MQVKLAYGRTGLEVDLPDTTAVIEPRFVPGLSDELEALRDALRSPIASPPLKELVAPGSSLTGA